jgi:hypothetical protein
MGDQVVPEHPGGRHGAAQDQAGVPAMPVILPSEQDADVPHLLLDKLSPTIGWQYRPQARGGPAFLIIHRSPLRDSRSVRASR